MLMQQQRTEEQQQQQKIVLQLPQPPQVKPCSNAYV